MHPAASPGSGTARWRGRSGDQCGAFFDGVLNICVSDCDPALPGSCDEGDLCIPLLDDGAPSGFTCSGPQQECLPIFDTMDPSYGHVGQCRLP